MKTLQVPVCPICQEDDVLLVSDHCEFQDSAVQQCISCGFIFTCPVPSVDSLQLFYREEYRRQRKEGLRRSYLRALDVRAASQFVFLNDKLPMYAIDSVFEIGCGPGKLLKRFQEVGKSVQGVEPDEVMSTYARDELGLIIATGLFYPQMFSAAKFDLVCLSHVLEHIVDPLGFLRDISTIMHIGAYLFVEVPNESVDKVRAMASRGTTSAHLSFFNVDTLTQTLRITGFEPQVVVTRGCRLDDLLSSLKRNPTMIERISARLRGYADIYSDNEYVKSCHPVEQGCERVALLVISRLVG